MAKKYIKQTTPFVVPTTDGKVIREHFGLASINDGPYSVAHMIAPSGWSEPYQTPAFDEITFVFRGQKEIIIEGEAPIILGPGESLLIKKNCRVKYANPFEEETEYLSICMPAFSMDLVNREAEYPVHSPILAKVANTCAQLEKEFSSIPGERKALLNQLSTYLANTYQQQQTPQLIVICTHNSRRSHLGQIWLSVAADYYGLPPIATFSGGTEATAFNSRAVHAMQQLGFDITTKTFKTPTNPIYEIKWQEAGRPYQAFSKKYDGSPNPSSDFGAIMVCTSADVGCPVISGADFRLALPFDDPKAFDDTPLEGAKYTERSLDIGREMLYVLSQV